MVEEITLKFKDLKFIVPKESECFWPYYGICFSGEYDWLLNNINDSDVVLDAGANIGIFSLLAAKKAKLVVSVEPVPQNFQILSKNIRINNTKNIIPINVALSNYVGQGYMYGRGLSATLSQDVGIPVNVVTIDVLLDQLGVNRVNLVKMDIEGSEGRALPGKYLKNVRMLIIEVHDKKNEESVKQILKAENFKIMEWRFSTLGTLGKIVENLLCFLKAEMSINWLATRLSLKYLFGLGKHPIPASSPTSDIKLLCAINKKIKMD